MSNKNQKTETIELELSREQTEILHRAISLFVKSEEQDNEGGSNLSRIAKSEFIYRPRNKKCLVKLVTYTADERRNRKSKEDMFKIEQLVQVHED